MKLRQIIVKKGNIVRCPANGRSPEHYATVQFVGEQVFENINGVKYVWVKVKPPRTVSDGCAIWPSCRLGSI